MQAINEWLNAWKDAPLNKLGLNSRRRSQAEMYLYLRRFANSGGDLAPSLGDGKFFRRTQDFWMTFFGGKISIFAAKISDDQIFQIFPFFSQIFPKFAMLNVIFDPFLTGKTPFLTLFILSRTSDNTTTLNIGGTNAWAVPHLKFFLGPSPPAPLGLRPCLLSLSFNG